MALVAHSLLDGLSHIRRKTRDVVLFVPHLTLSCPVAGSLQRRRDLDPSLDRSSRENFRPQVSIARRLQLAGEVFPAGRPKERSFDPRAE